MGSNRTVRPSASACRVMQRRARSFRRQGRTPVIHLRADGPWPRRDGARWGWPRRTYRGLEAAGTMSGSPPWPHPLRKVHRSSCSVRLRRSVLGVRPCVEQGAPLGGRARNELADLDARPDGADYFGQAQNDGHDAHYQGECRD